VRLARAQVKPTTEIFNTVSVAVGWEDVCVCFIAVIIAGGVAVVVGVIQLKRGVTVVAVSVAGGVAIVVGVIQLKRGVTVVAVDV
jgi:hypothetical protein